MKIIQPSYEIWPQEEGVDGIYRQVERVGRVCYKSEDHVTADSARPFVGRLIANEHFAMLEHASVWLAAPAGELDFYRHNRFSRFASQGGTDYVSTNFRVVAEGRREADLKRFLSPCLPQHERRVTVHFTTQIATTREFNRHRVNSMAEQSTRYCNYSKNKFGGEISVNRPEWVAAEPGGDTTEQGAGTLADLVKALAQGADKWWGKLDNWLFANLAAERAYMNLIRLGCKPQEARAILPLDTNTELVHTAFVDDWKHFFDLRALGTTGAPHPDAKALAEPLRRDFVRRGWIADE